MGNDKENRDSMGHYSTSLHCTIQLTSILDLAFDLLCLNKNLQRLDHQCPWLAVTVQHPYIAERPRLWLFRWLKRKTIHGVTAERPLRGHVDTTSNVERKVETNLLFREGNMGYGFLDQE
jgi:hypothetical protein